LQQAADVQGSRLEISGPAIVAEHLELDIAAHGITAFPGRGACVKYG
jgi:hypothetical protein